MIYSASEVVCDYLDVTYSPDSQMIGSEFYMGSLVTWLLSVGAVCRKRDATSSLFTVGDHGTIKTNSNSVFTRVSASGATLAHLRAHGLFMEYLSELASEPHRVTRLDAALDVARDGSEVISEMRTMFPDGKASLGRKHLNVTYMTGIRSDGKESGTCYIGHRQRARQTARVYDKALEALEKRGEHLPPTSRYEITIRGERGRPSPTLRDAAEPTSVFWHVASPTLLQAPASAAPWVPSDGDSWVVKRPELLPAEIVARRISYNPDLDSIAQIASQDGQGGLKLMLRQIAQKYQIDL